MRCLLQKLDGCESLMAAVFYILLGIGICAALLGKVQDWVEHILRIFVWDWALFAAFLRLS